MSENINKEQEQTVQEEVAVEETAQETQPDQETPVKEEEKKEETITFTPGPGVTAIVHDQNAQPATESDDLELEANPDSDEQTLIALWRMYKESNPDGTLDDFYTEVSTTNNEVQ